MLQKAERLKSTSGEKQRKQNRAGRRVVTSLNESVEGVVESLSQQRGVESMTKKRRANSLCVLHLHMSDVWRDEMV